MLNKNRLNKDFDYDVTLDGTSEKNYDFVNDVDAQYYAPFHNLVVFNYGTQPIRVFLNSATGSRLVPAGTIAKFENKTINTLRITNSTAVADTFTLNLNNDISDNEYLQAIYEGK